MSQVEPTSEQVQALSQLPAGTPLVMINLLAFKGAEGPNTYARYAGKAQPHLERAGGHVLYMGSARQMVIGEGERPWWDAVVVVEYPSVERFLAMIRDPEYLAIHVHRADALERAELIATRTGL